MSEQHFKQDRLVILPRPQISISVLENHQLTISTAQISDDFDEVEFDEVTIPFESLRQVIETLQGIALEHGIE